MHTMQKLFAAAALFYLSVTASAHPPVGIVADARGNIYYSDLAQVWRLSPDGSRSVVVPNVHTHELVLDAAGNLYGENLRYEGEATNRWWHSYWRRSPDGKITRIVAEHEPFHNEDAGFTLVRDTAGNNYWVNAQTKAVMRNAQVLARGPFRDIRWMTVAPDGSLFFIDTADLMRLSPRGEVKALVRNLATTRRIRPDIELRHAVLGLWTDRAGNVYAADFAHGQAKRITPAGVVTVIAESHLPWSVTGGTFAPNGDLWLLETSVGNEVRVRKVGVK
jgi:hypothetical protein